MADEVLPTAQLVWHNIADWGVEGKGWTDSEHYYDRFPAKAKGVVRPPVWNLSTHSAGLCTRFQTDATTIKARWTLRSSTLALPHMPSTGVSGLDLYVQVREPYTSDDHTRQWRWLGVGIPDSNPQIEKDLIAGLVPALRTYLLYLPLYNGVESVEIGVPEGATFIPVPPRESKPIVFYGTSIMQGGCASRPGMCHTAILGRYLDRVVVNLGFSGSGTMDIEIGGLMSELDACIYVIDCLPNMSPEMVTERTVPLVRIIRETRPNTPIVLVEDRTYGNSHMKPNQQDLQAKMRAALHQAFTYLVESGDTNLHYITGDGLLGDDDEATVDGSHATDLGFMRMAEVLEPVLRTLVTKDA